MSAISSVLKQRVAKLMRIKIKEGLPQDLANIVRKEMFEILDDEDFIGVAAVLLAALMDYEVENYAEE